MRFFDNFLSYNEFTNIQRAAKELKYEPLAHGDDIAYKLDSGLIYKTHNKFWPHKPGPFEHFFQKLQEIEPGEWSLMVHVYEPGAEISWHRDYSSKKAYSFYIHPQWSSEWGGQFMWTECEDYNNNNGNVFDHRQEVMNPGIGQYLEPLPNRLVIIDDEFHKVNRCNHRRISMTGFLK